MSDVNSPPTDNAPPSGRGKRTRTATILATVVVAVLAFALPEPTGQGPVATYILITAASPILAALLLSRRHLSADELLPGVTLTVFAVMIVLAIDMFLVQRGDQFEDSGVPAAIAGWFLLGFSLWIVNLIPAVLIGMFADSLRRD